MPSRSALALDAVAALAALVASAATPLAAQRPPVPQLTLVEEWRIDAKAHHLEQSGQVSIAPNGSVIIAPGFGLADGMRAGRGDGFRTARADIVAFDSLGKRVLWRLTTGFRGDVEIRFVDRIGWTGTQMWISDRGFRQIALVDNAGVMTKSVAHPTFVRPRLGERRKYPVFEGAEPLARYADGSLLVRPLRKQDVFDTPEFDSTATHLLRVSADGIISASVAHYPPLASVTFRSGRGAAVVEVPLQNRTLWNVSPDGTRIVLVGAAMSGRDSATFGVVTLDERGDTVHARRFPFTPARLTDKGRDSVVRARRAGVAGQTDEQVRAALLPLVPRFFPPVEFAFIGRDRTTWIGLRPAAGDTVSQPVLVLDPQGAPMGRVAVPRRTIVLAADRDHAWAAVRESGGVVALVRYRLVLRN